MGIHFRLGPDEPGFIIGGGFIADCYTGNMAYKTNTGNRHSIQVYKTFKIPIRQRKRKKNTKPQRLTWHTCTQH